MLPHKSQDQKHDLSTSKINQTSSRNLNKIEDQFDKLIKFNMEKNFESVENDLHNLTSIITKEKKLRKRYQTLQSGKVATPETEEIYRKEQKKLMQAKGVKFRI